MKFTVKLCVTVLSLLVLHPFGQVWADEIYKIDNARWLLESDQVTRATIDGRKAIKIVTGRAMLEDVELENGTVEFDMYLPKERAFSYLYFRGQSDAEVEALYLRSHKSKAPDAIQYAPVFQRRSAWQLYHGKTGTGPASFPSGKWFKVKVELMGQEMKVWIDDQAEPVLDIKELGRKSAAGWLAFRGFVPRTSDAKFSAYFGDLKVTRYTGEEIKARPAPALSSDVITQWRVSPAFDSKPGPVLALPEQLSKGPWGAAEMRSDGAFELLRSRTVPENSRHWSAAADITLTSQKKQICKIHFGFSDELTLMVNGQPVLYQDHSYRFADNRQQGVMHYDQVVAFVHLEKGKNSLRAIVSDRFGGWGLMARMNQCDRVIAE